MANREAGYFLLHRRMFDGDDPFWSQNRVFSRAEAWIDMIYMAAYRDHQRVIRGRLIDIPRGSIVASERYLARRWRWSKTSVHRFLGVLEAMNRLSRKSGPPTDQVEDRLSICNYNTYQQSGTIYIEESGPATDQQRTSNGPNRSKGSKGKEGNERNERTTPPIVPPKGGVDKTEIESEFDVCWKAYPSRYGSNPRKPALEKYSRLRKSGVSADDLLKAVSGYARWATDSESDGTERVMQAMTFFGPNDRWREWIDWQAPRRTAQKGIYERY